MEIKVYDNDKILDDFQLYFSDYFDVELVVDDEIQDYYGEEYKNVCIDIKDKDLDKQYRVLIQKDNTTHYNTYDDVIDELDHPEDLWKYMYFELHTKIKYDLK